jgi:hypothetical protein
MKGNVSGKVIRDNLKMNTANIDNTDNIRLPGEPLRFTVELAGTAARALSGVLVDAQKRLDAAGVCIAGFLAAFGGGVLRAMIVWHNWDLPAWQID